MKNKKLAVCALILAGMIGGAKNVLAGNVIKIDGSSTVYPITEAVAEEFQTAKKGAMKATVGISGTGGGFKKFCRGDTDISDASRPIQKKEMDDCYLAGVKYYELPIAYDALTVVVNPNNPLSVIKVSELKTLWAPEAQGKIKTWNQVNPAWSAEAVKLFGAGSDSGTFDYFTEAVVGKAKSSRGDYTASEDDNVLVQGVANDKNALGYFGMAYYEENKTKLKAVAIDNGKGGILPSAETVKDGSYVPLARPIFIYVNANSYDTKPEVKEFVDFYLKNAQALVPQVKYVALPAEDYAEGAKRLENKKLGTGFGGKSEVGLKVSDLLKREPKL